MTNTTQKMNSVGKTLTLYVTGGFIVLILWLLFWPLGLVAMVFWLWMIVKHRS